MKTNPIDDLAKSFRENKIVIDVDNTKQLAKEIINNRPKMKTEQNLLLREPSHSASYNETVTITAERYEWLIKVSVEYKRLMQNNSEPQSIGNIDIERDSNTLKTPVLINTAGIPKESVIEFESKSRRFKHYKFGQNNGFNTVYYDIKPLSETETTITFEVCSPQ